MQRRPSQANIYLGTLSVTIVLLLDEKEQDRKTFPTSLKGCGDQFKYFRDWEAKGKNHTWKRI